MQSEKYNLQYNRMLKENYTHKKIYLKKMNSFQNNNDA
jgi:hypothetical protein